MPEPSTQPAPIEPGRLRLAYRLLCACNLAYGVSAGDANGTPFAIVPPVLPSDEVIAAMQTRSGLLPDSLHTCQADGGGIDALLYGETPDAAVLAFRGTLPVRLIADPGRARQIVTDWINNAKVALIDGRPFDLPGLVHAGFAESLEHLWRAPDGVGSLFPRIRKAAASGKPLFVTGHSKGGALACLAAARLAGAGLTPAGVYTFAAPRPASCEFAEDFARTFGTSACRFEFRNDIVPMLPPSEGFWSACRQALNVVVPQSAGTGGASPPATLIPGFGPVNWIRGYESAGYLLFIDQDGRLIEGDGPQIQTDRSRRLARALVFSPAEIGKAHLPMEGFGYMNFLGRWR